MNNNYTKIIKYLASPYTDVNHKISTHGTNLPILDGVRGLAVLIVLASHTSAFCMYGQGSLGVLLFFFLSGFVLVIPYAENPKIFFDYTESTRFFLSRAFRIIPAYVVIVGAIALIQQTGYEWFLWNVSFLKGWNHLWSVAEEVRFYILLPVLLALFAILRNKYLIILSCLLIMFISYYYRNKHQIDLMDGRFVGFYFYIFVGGMLTYMLTTLEILNKNLRKIYIEKLFSTLSLIIFLSFIFSSSEMINKLWRPLFHNLPDDIVLNAWRIPHIWMILFIFFFFSLTFFSKSTVKNLLQHYFFRHIGLLSYSIYLSHMIILFKLRDAGFQKEGLFFAVLAVSYCVSIISYLFVEKPFLLLKKKISHNLRSTVVNIH